MSVPDSQGSGSLFDTRQCLVDLNAVKGWIESHTYCSLQRSEGWYWPDCLERRAKSKCERCKMLARLYRQIERLS